MPRPITLAQHQRHSVLVMSQALSARAQRSPFTLVLDDLNQQADQILTTMIARGLSRGINVVYVAFEHPSSHPAVRFIPAFGTHSHHTGDQILAEIERAIGIFKESLVIVDSFHDLFDIKGVQPVDFGNLINKYDSYTVGVYHQDIATPVHATSYAPSPLEVTKFMATAIFTCKSLAQVLAAKAAKERSLPEPTFGLLQGAEGIVQSITANDLRGVVIDAEFRRVSGRPEFETFWLRRTFTSDFEPPLAGLPFGPLKQEFVMCLEQLPLYCSDETMANVNAKADEIDVPFKLELTLRQKKVRDGVLLPHFDAQGGEGGEGGRILYEMGEEDDFDEEEDEI
ncbi:uncharacterized protein BDR25DRAFT_223108 [Lindgomyces ingoldianus]|uniref:Uncharacterized protein n=1 Tax=Lindgomyces ingoldianus TaxID=673940 RepID=A0ACB6QVW9_9PLEO|nr:uncharacterized protein BDR25DRAFT_223108 [Lindgomyces ingoldianus]KAF2471184.1 hypothetical protein BDR25DRAFT_223108 [Lindgomyces ingoldianus]